MWTLRVVLSLQSLEKSRVACSHLFHVCLFSPVGLLSGPGPIPRWTCPHLFLVHTLWTLSHIQLVSGLLPQLQVALEQALSRHWEKHLGVGLT